MGVYHDGMSELVALNTALWVQINNRQNTQGDRIRVCKFKIPTLVWHHQHKQSSDEDGLQLDLFAEVGSMNMYCTTQISIFGEKRHPGATGETDFSRKLRRRTRCQEIR